ncbi:MAG: DUF1667 domain-containing protein [Clostridium sp.]|uniref:DUF1667 domain-containing protein n=1 Tax=Clostridium sp. TaxID=1506 RepID=UPI00303645E6
MKEADILTTVVRVKGSIENKVVSVRSSEPICKDLWLECSKCLGRIYVGPQTSEGDVICKNILNTGVDIICTKSIYKSK